jgi:hypothetical protein
LHGANIDTVTPAPEVVRPDDLQRALASRADIDQAKGILIALHRVSGEDAWQMLSAASQHRNIKLRLIAEALVELMTGKKPRDATAASVARQLLPANWTHVGDASLTAADRRLLGDQRDRFAANRDAAAAGRDNAAEDRDSKADPREVAVGAAADRAAALQDRWSAAVDRELSADDRDAAEAAERTQNR